MLIRASVDEEARNTGNNGPRSGVAKRIKNVSPQRHRGHREEPVDYFLICQIEDPGELYRGRTDKSKRSCHQTNRKGRKVLGNKCSVNKVIKERKLAKPILNF